MPKGDSLSFVENSFLAKIGQKGPKNRVFGILWKILSFAFPKNIAK